MDDNLHSEIMRAIGRLEGKVDGIKEQLVGFGASLKNHDNRINAVASDVAGIKGKAAILGGIAGTTIAVAWEFIKNKLFK